MPDTLTEQMIADAMARAEKLACAPGDTRCLPLPDDIQGAESTRTPKGRCKVGWIVADAARKAWDVWLDVHTGGGRLQRRDSRRRAARGGRVC